VIAASLAIGWRSACFSNGPNRAYRARHAENRDMAEGLGVNASKIFALVFTVGCMLARSGGALVVPSGAASLDMAVDLVVESFAVVVIGGPRQHARRAGWRVTVGLMRAAAISLMPELEMLSVYWLSSSCLFQAAGLFGKATA